MANWSFATGDALTRKAWAKKWWIGAKTESYFYTNGLIGKSYQNSIIVEMSDLEKEQGDVIYYGQVCELSGAGVLNDGTMEGNEEAPATYDDAITITQKRNAIRSDGRLSGQRPADGDLRMWAMELLDRWIAAEIDQDLFDALGTSPTKVLYGGDATTTATIEAGDYFTLALIAKAVAYARKATPKITGPTMGGKRLNGVVVISPDQSFDLTTRDSAWVQSRMDAALRGNDNPIFTGALGMHKNVPIHEHERVAISTTWGSASNLNGATALFMGCGAGAIAYTIKKIWEEKTFDYQFQAGFCTGAQYGVTKSVFNSADNALVAIRTYRTSN